MPDDNVRAESEQHRRDLLASGRLLSGDAFQIALSMTRDDIRNAILEKRFFTVDIDGQPYYPAFYGNRQLDRCALESVLRVLGELPGWTKWDFFTAARGSFGDVNALKALAQGKLDLALRIARAFAVDESD